MPHMPYMHLPIIETACYKNFLFNLNFLFFYHLSPLTHYNSLIDINLQGYYSKPLVRDHLKKVGLINRKGEIIPEVTWRKMVLNRDRMELASRICANRIVQKYNFIFYSNFVNHSLLSFIQ